MSKKKEKELEDKLSKFQENISKMFEDSKFNKKFEEYFEKNIIDNKKILNG